jgi:glutathione S-transferase
VKLYGTTTSPFVRRVRVVAAEIGEPVELIDTATDAGQARLRAASPIWKVPVAEIGDRTLYDSRVIIDWLVTTRGWGTLAPTRDRWREENRLSAIHGALDSLIQLLYLKREHVALDGLPYRQRQEERTAAILEWLGGQLVDGGHFGDGFGLSELSLVCAIEWMQFRQMYPTERHAAIAAFHAAWRERPSLAATRPHV